MSKKAWGKTTKVEMAIKPPKSIEELFKHHKELSLRRGLRVGIWGEPESGKTYFCCTAPEPVFIIDTEWGALPVIKQHFPDKDIKVFQVRVEEATDPTKIDYFATFSKIAEAVSALKDVEEGTICIDTISDVYTWLNAYTEERARARDKLTKIGRPERLEWSIRNLLYRNLIFRLLSKNCNIVLTAQPQRVYDSRGRETNIFIPRWLQPQPHWLDIVIYLKKIWDGTSTKYKAMIEKVRFMRAYNYTTDDITFDKLVKILRDELGVTVAKV